MVRCALALLVLAAMAMPAAAQALPAGVTKVTNVEGISEYRLANGLRVILFPDPTKSNITVNATYMVGSRHEGYGETGMAHLLEHLLFMGTERHPDIKKELTDHGARPNGSTWYDRTNYFETFQATEENLRWALDMEADRMMNSRVEKKYLDSEMTVVRNEFEMGENDPGGVLMERVISTAYLWHNYGKSTIGARADIERVPIDRLQAFYRRYYRPDNAILVVAGKIDEAKTLQMVHQYFGVLKNPAEPVPQTYTVEPTQDGERHVTLRRVGDTQMLAAVYHIAAGSHDDFAPMQIATRILSDAPSGRLYKAMVESKKAASVMAMPFQLKDPGILLIMSEVRTESDLNVAKTALTSTMDGLPKTPFTQEEVERAKTQILKGIDLMMNNSEQVAMSLSEWQSMGDWRLLFLHRDRVRKVTAADVNRVAGKYLVASNRTLGEFIPEKSPVRAEIPEAPDVAALVKDYKGDAQVSMGEAFDASPSNIDKRTIRGDLKGGLKLSFINKKTRGEQVTATIALHFGDEKSLMNRTAAGELAGAMLMRGTAKRTRQELKDEFDKLKAQVSIGGSATGASASIQTTKENLPKVLDLVAEVLKEPAFPENEFENLRQAQLAAMEGQKSEPQALAMIELQRKMAPYAKGDVRYVDTIDESIADLKAAKLDDLKAFYKDFYGASNGEAVIIGDFEPEATQQQLSRLFNEWKSPKPYTRVAKSFKAIPAEAKAIETPDKANAMWVAGLPVQLKDTDAEYPALVLGNYILGSSGMGSRLFGRIRNKEGLSYGVGSAFSGTPTEDLQMLFAYAICAPENAPKVEASFKDELAQIITKGYTQEEVDAAKKSWMQSRQVSRAQDRELAGRMQSQRFFGRTMAFDSEMEAKVMAVTPAQIQAAMKKHFDAAKMSFYRAGDFKRVNVAW
ncbi:MAG: insulinase family protein [Candidatus Solibacter sp.]|nr:insulinase family protein [Candidatus Solibacter sp.]